MVDRTAIVIAGLAGSCRTDRQITSPISPEILCNFPERYRETRLLHPAHLLGMPSTIVV